MGMRVCGSGRSEHGEARGQGRRWRAHRAGRREDLGQLGRAVCVAADDEAEAVREERAQVHVVGEYFVGLQHLLQTPRGG